MQIIKNTIALFPIVLILLFLSIPSFASPASYVIAFSTEMYAHPCEVSVNPKVKIDVTLPSAVSSGQSKEATIDLWLDWTTATLKHELFLPQEKMFITPLGDSSRIHIGTFAGELRYYVALKNASVLMNIKIEGNGTVSQSSLLWSSAGSKSLTISHTGSTSSEEILTLQLSFKYAGSLTVLTTGDYGIIVDEKVQEIEAEGDQTISENIDIVPKQTPQQPDEPEDSDQTTSTPPTQLWIGAAFVIVVIAATVAFVLGRASKKPKE